MDKERMAELEKIEAHGAENGWGCPDDRGGQSVLRIFSFGV